MGQYWQLVSLYTACNFWGVFGQNEQALPTWFYYWGALLWLGCLLGWLWALHLCQHRR